MGLSVVITFQGPAEHLDAARERARQRRVPLAVVLREALELYLTFQGPAEHLDAARERARQRRVPLAVVLREALELYLDCDERDVAEYFGPSPGARRVRAERVHAEVGE